MRSQQGFALVVVLWILSLLIIMAGSFAQTVRRETAIVSAIKQHAQAQAQAEAGIYLAQFMLQAPDPKKRWQGDGRIYQTRFNDADLRIQIIAETGKVDLNTADAQHLGAVLAYVLPNQKQQQTLLNAILDWRDEDEEPRKAGAEAPAYRQAGLAYTPRNGAFQSLDEVQQVLGMEAPLFESLKPFLTVYSGQADVDLSAASPEMLQLLTPLMGQEAITEQLKARQMSHHGAEDGESETIEFSNEDVAYSILAEARLEDGTQAALSAVIKSQSLDTEAPFFQTLEWQTVMPDISLFSETFAHLLVTEPDEFRYQR